MTQTASERVGVYMYDGSVGVEDVVLLEAVFYSVRVE